MSSSQRSTASKGYSWSTARMNRETRTSSPSQHQVTPPTRIITPPRQPQQQVHQSRTTSPKHNLFTSSDHHDDDSILSTGSNNPKFMLIVPHDNFPKYGLWLKKQFPDIISSTGGFFVHSQLKIRSQNDIDDYLEYSPEDWQEHLPRSYHIWRKTIIELVIIWTVTSYMEGCIPYTRYLEIRDEMLPTLNSIYEEIEASKIYSSNNNTPNLVKSPQSPPTLPPPYQQKSPTVIQWQSKCMKDNDTEPPDGLQWWQKYYKMQEEYKRKKNTPDKNLEPIVMMTMGKFKDY